MTPIEFILSLVVGIGLSIVWVSNLVHFIKDLRAIEKDKKIREGEYVNTSIPEVVDGYIVDRRHGDRRVYDYGRPEGDRRKGERRLSEHQRGN